MNNLYLDDIKNLPTRSFFKKIPYSTTWEDFDIIQQGLQIGKNDTVLSISSAGCNVLNALLCNPRKIVAIDANPHQNYLLKFKIAAIKHLDYQHFLEILGIIPSNRRHHLYNTIKNHLEPDVRKFWDKHLDLIEMGITYNGRQERYIQLLGKYLRFLKGKKTVENLITHDTLEEQRNYFNKHVRDYAWHLFFNLVYCKPVMLVAKDKLVFEQISDNSYHKKFRERVENFLNQVHVKNNPFVSLALLGYYRNEDYYPHYLKQKNFTKLKQRINRIEVNTAPIQTVLSETNENTFSKLNLSNVLDWADPHTFRHTLKEIGRVATDNARFCYFNTLMERPIPQDLSFITSYKEKARQLLQNDKAFLYENFEIGEITKPQEDTP